MTCPVFDLHCDTAYRIAWQTLPEDLRRACGGGLLRPRRRGRPRRLPRARPEPLPRLARGRRQDTLGAVLRLLHPRRALPRTGGALLSARLDVPRGPGEEVRRRRDGRAGGRGNPPPPRGRAHGRHPNNRERAPSLPRTSASCHASPSRASSWPPSAGTPRARSQAAATPTPGSPRSARRRSRRWSAPVWCSTSPPPQRRGPRGRARPHGVPRRGQPLELPAPSARTRETSPTGSSWRFATEGASWASTSAAASCARAPAAGDVTFDDVAAHVEHWLDLGGEGVIALGAGLRRRHRPPPSSTGRRRSPELQALLTARFGGGRLRAALLRQRARVLRARKRLGGAAAPRKTPRPTPGWRAGRGTGKEARRGGAWRDPAPRWNSEMG